MRGVIRKGVLFCAVVILLAGVSQATAEDTTGELGTLKSDLQNSGVSAEDTAAIAGPLEEMMEEGATADELKNAVSGLAGMGLKGKELKESVDEMSDLIEHGEKPAEAGNLVSQAAKQAKEQGLQGKALSDKVHEAVELRKQTMHKAKHDAKKKPKEIDKKVGAVSKGAEL